MVLEKDCLMTDADELEYCYYVGGIMPFVIGPKSESVASQNSLIESQSRTFEAL